MKKIINSSKVVMGMLLRTFSTREKEPMLRMFNTYIKSKMEYCCIVWSPVNKKWIYELEKIQKSFTSKINGMEELDYHERLEKLNLYTIVTIVTIVGFCLPIGDMATTCTGSPFTLVMPTFSLINQAIC